MLANTFWKSNTVKTVLSLIRIKPVKLKPNLSEGSGTYLVWREKLERKIFPLTGPLF